MASQSLSDANLGALASWESETAGSTKCVIEDLIVVVHVSAAPQTYTIELL